MDLHIEEENLKAVLEAGVHGDKVQQSEEELVQEALTNPIGSKKLSELAVGKKKVVIVTSDHTRAVPSKITLPLELKEIRMGNPDAEITILIATGLHRATTQEEQRRMFGDAIVDHERIVVNDAYETADFVDMGRLPSGAVFYVNKLAADCDLLICEGFIEPHFFAGYFTGDLLRGNGKDQSFLSSSCKSLCTSGNFRAKPDSRGHAGCCTEGKRSIHIKCRTGW